MPRSDAETGYDEKIPGQNLAVIAESLFLGNLLIAPGICFAILFWLWLRNKDDAPPLARQHLKQTTYVSLWGGILIIVMYEHTGVITSKALELTRNKKNM